MLSDLVSIFNIIQGMANSGAQKEGCWSPFAWQAQYFARVMTKSAFHNSVLIKQTCLRRVSSKCVLHDCLTKLFQKSCFKEKYPKGSV